MQEDEDEEQEMQEEVTDQQQGQVVQVEVVQERELWIQVQPMVQQIHEDEEAVQTV